MAMAMLEMPPQMQVAYDIGEPLFVRDPAGVVKN